MLTSEDFPRDNFFVRRKLGQIVPRSDFLASSFTPSETLTPALTAKIAAAKKKSRFFLLLPGLSFEIFRNFLIYKCRIEIGVLRDNIIYYRKRTIGRTYDVPRGNLRGTCSVLFLQVLIIVTYLTKNQVRQYIPRSLLLLTGPASNPCSHSS